MVEEDTNPCVAAVWLLQLHAIVCFAKEEQAKLAAEDRVTLSPYLSISIWF